MKILKINVKHPEPELLREAADIILSDGVIGYPTETVYGLGANALSEAAVERVFQLKGRDKTKPILIIAVDRQQVNTMVASFPRLAEVLAQKFWPGPLTMVLDASPTVPKSLLGFGNRIGVRIPDHKVCLELIKLCGVPITSTSANISGQINPISAEEVGHNFGNKLDLIIDGGRARSRTVSTVVAIVDDCVTLIRAGAISKPEIEQVIGKKLNQ